MFRKITTYLLALAIALPFFSSCGEGLGGPENKKNQYTVEAREMFSAEGVSVSAIAGEYSSDPDFQVVNQSEQDYLIVIDTIVYNDICQPKTTLGTDSVYIVPAGTDKKLSECEKIAIPTVSFTTDASWSTTINSSFSTLVTYTAEAITKREYRFAVYSITADDTTSKNETVTVKKENLVYRSDLILLNTSNYKESEFSKTLPTEECLWEQDGIRIWVQAFPTTISSIQISGATANNAKIQYDMNITVDSSVLTDSYIFDLSTAASSLSFVTDNESAMDLRVEFTVSPGEIDENKKEESKEKDEKKENTEKENEKEAVGPFTLYSEILAGKAANWSHRTDGIKSNPRWLSSYKTLLVTICVYNAETDTLLYEQADLTIPYQELLQAASTQISNNNSLIFEQNQNQIHNSQSKETLHADKPKVEADQKID